jgi:hypothetical protein
MIKNYFKIARRNLITNNVSFVINIGGEREIYFANLLDRSDTCSAFVPFCSALFRFVPLLAERNRQVKAVKYP